MAMDFAGSATSDTLPDTDSNPSGDWQQQLARAITEPQQLLQYLQLDAQHFGDFSAASRQFSIRVPHAYLRKIRPGEADDPLLLQIMAQAEESHQVAGFKQDPVGDLQASQAPGLLHKYPGRVLLITTGACAVHCRYCFRRHFPYAQQQAGRDQWQSALDYIRAEQSIEEVILSGGDPLVLSDHRLSMLIEQLQAIPHISRLRLHSRLPVVLPDRITDRLIEILASSRFDTALVIHANHASEIAADETRVLRKLQAAGILLLNQAVLLKGINHRLEQQQALSRALFSAGVLPYYLHLLDSVQGAAHFDVGLQQANQLMEQLRASMPGFLVPRLVREIEGEQSKTPANEL